MNLDRKIAAKAKELVEPLHGTNFTTKESEYRALCESFPILLRTAGLVQSVAFLKAKKEHPHGTLAGHLEIQMRGIELLPAGKDLVEIAATRNAAEYRLYSQMAARVAYWHKRMAQAYLITKKEGAKP